MEFKDRIKELRLEKNLSLAEIAAQFEKKSDAAIRAWETGRTKPDADTLIKLAQYFNCTTDYLLGLSDARFYKSDEKDREIKKLQTKILQYDAIVARAKEMFEAALLQTPSQLTE